MKTQKIRVWYQVRYTDVVKATSIRRRDRVYFKVKGVLYEARVCGIVNCNVNKQRTMHNYLYGINFSDIRSTVISDFMMPYPRHHIWRQHIDPSDKLMATCWSNIHNKGRLSTYFNERITPYVKMNLDIDGDIVDVFELYSGKRVMVSLCSGERTRYEHILRNKLKLNVHRHLQIDNTIGETTNLTSIV